MMLLQMMDAWSHNLNLLYRLIAPACETSEPLRIPSDRKWTGLVFVPRMILSEAIQHPDLASAEIIGGWPLIAAFYTEKDYLLALLRFHKWH